MVNNRIGKDGIISIQRFKQVQSIGHTFIKFLNTLRKKAMWESWSLYGLTLLYYDNVLYTGIFCWSELKRCECLCFSMYVIYSCKVIPFICNVLLFVSFNWF